MNNQASYPDIENAFARVDRAKLYMDLGLGLIYYSIKHNNMLKSISYKIGSWLCRASTNQLGMAWAVGNTEIGPEPHPVIEPLVEEISSYLEHPVRQTGEK